VKHRDVLRNPRARMPAQEVIVVLADFARSIVVAKVVVVGLG
jgi:hypothetical protein